jgi:channel protein (hemolysin III family)
MSHLLGAIVALAETTSLLRLARGNAVRLAALSVYAFCVIVALAVSGAYHSLPRGCAARDVMQRLDYLAIWLLIAGTFTAVHGVMHEGPFRARLLTFVWSYAVLAIGAQGLWFKTFSSGVGLVLYLGLGWVGIVSVLKLGRELGYAAVRPLWGAGIAYSAGAILEAMSFPTIIRHWVGPHEIFHFAVLIGVALHWTFIRRLLTSHLPVQVPVESPLEILVKVPAQEAVSGELAPPWVGPP